MSSPRTFFGPPNSAGLAQKSVNLSNSEPGPVGYPVFAGAVIGNINRSASEPANLRGLYNTCDGVAFVAGVLQTGPQFIVPSDPNAVGVVIKQPTQSDLMLQKILSKMQQMEDDLSAVRGELAEVKKERPMVKLLGRQAIDVGVAERYKQLFMQHEDQLVYAISASPLYVTWASALVLRGSTLGQRNWTDSDLITRGYKTLKMLAHDGPSDPSGELLNILDEVCDIFAQHPSVIKTMNSEAVIGAVFVTALTRFMVPRDQVSHAPISAEALRHATDESSYGHDAEELFCMRAIWQIIP